MRWRFILLLPLVIIPGFTVATHEASRAYVAFAIEPTGCPLTQSGLWACFDVLDADSVGISAADEFRGNQMVMRVRFETATGIAVGPATTICRGGVFAVPPEAVRVVVSLDATGWLDCGEAPTKGVIVAGLS